MNQVRRDVHPTQATNQNQPGSLQPRGYAIVPTPRSHAACIARLSGQGRRLTYVQAPNCPQTPLQQTLAGRPLQKEPLGTQQLPF